MHRPARTVRSARLAFLALAATCAVLLTACATGGSGEPAAGSDTSLSPLEEYLAPLAGGAASSRDAVDQERRRTDELVAECMAAEGFEYRPIIAGSTGPAIGSEQEEGEFDPDSDAFVDRYGYGIADWPGAEEDRETTQQVIDPNQAYVSSLSASEQSAYWIALTGKDPMADLGDDPDASEGGEDAYDWTSHGCLGAARHGVQSELASARKPYDDPAFTELFAAQDALDARIDDDEETLALQSEWLACMAEQGHSEFDSPGAAQQALGEEYDSMAAEAAPDGSSGEIPDTDLDAFMARELAVAGADRDCRDALDYERRLESVRAELERRFIEAHREELDALLSRYATIDHDR